MNAVEMRPSLTLRPRPTKPLTSPSYSSPLSTAKKRPSSVSARATPTARTPWGSVTHRCHPSGHVPPGSNPRHARPPARQPKDCLRACQFIFSTDGNFFEAEDLTAGAQEPVADFLPNLANHFGFLLPLAGISTVREIKDNPIDVRATGRLNKLYVELLRTNPDWGTAARRHDMNHFMARLIFCYFAEHTDIFHGTRLFTDTLEQMSEGDGGPARGRPLDSEIARFKHETEVLELLLETLEDAEHEAKERYMAPLLRKLGFSS